MQQLNQSERDSFWNKNSTKPNNPSIQITKYSKDYALATSAYIDNFEFIEAPFAEKDNNVLMKNTEAMIGEQLIHLIQYRYV